MYRVSYIRAFHSATQNYTLNCCNFVTSDLLTPNFLLLWIHFDSMNFEHFILEGLLDH